MIQDETLIFMSNPWIMKSMGYGVFRMILFCPWTIAVNGGARRVSLFRRLGGEVAAPQRRRRNRSGRSQAAAGRKESFPFRTRRLSIHVDFAEHAGPCGWCSGDAQPSFAVTRHHQEVTSPWSGPAVARIIPPAPAEYPSTRSGCGRIRGPGCSWT